MIELSEYTLETLREDDDFILYRGDSRHRDNGNEPSVLAVAPVSDPPAPTCVRRLEHEFSIRTELDPTWAARPLALSQHNGHPMLVLEYPGGEPLDQVIRKPIEMTQFLRIGVGLANALSHLHARGLIHKDIRPSNVLFDPASGKVWLMGFGIASHLPRERQPPEAPESIAGTLCYMAPEQTGRMNRSTDSRSDLYAFGVTLYEVLTGGLPFIASDPMEWVHCHIARQPVSPGERKEGIPGSVSAVIMKLLAKTAEERYQTASGAETDLRRCLAEWEAKRAITRFAPGEHDTPDLIFIPEKLYGRAKEIESLLASFNRVVATGTPELVLVSGYSGIGKSSVVNELHKVLVLPRGLFASGKFDQYKRDIPYATLAQAFGGLVRPLLTRSDAEIGRWRDAFREALGPNARLMTDLIPELKFIMGEQPPVPDLPPQDAQGRFQLVFLRFIGVFARQEHPLALFLDDLQWLDAATLDFLDYLLTRPDLKHLLLIGAYRDNEVDSSHPLARRIETIRRAGAIVRDIVLVPLAGEDLGQLLADSLHSKSGSVAPLARLIHEKTAGNPFFSIQFLTSLAEEALLTFNHDDERWTWDLDRIHAKRYTDNVVDLMVGKVNRLPLRTQQALQQLACLGNSADFDLLAMVFGDSREEMHADLLEAVRSGLVLRSERAYRFLHDRVQEAAYSIIPEEQRGAAHVRIGRLMESRTPPEEIEDKIFEIVGQLNRGGHLITSAKERVRTAELNLIAGKRAKLSTAYASALAYLSAGRKFLEEDAWDRNFELIFEIEFTIAECQLLTADMAPAEERLSMLARRARSKSHVAAVARTRLTLYTTLDRSDRCVEVFLEYIGEEGSSWSAHPTNEQARREFDRIFAKLGSRSIEELVDLPIMNDTGSLAAIDVLSEMVTPALFTDENLLSLVICYIVNLSLERGNSDGTCCAYVWLGMIAGPRFQNYEAGFRFGRLGYDLVEKRGLRRFEARTYMSFGNLVMPWTKHVLAGRDLVRRAFDTANRMGDLTFAAYSCNNLNTNLLAAGDPLGDVQREVEAGLKFAQKARFGLVIDIITAQLGLVRTLRGLTPKFGSFDEGNLDELQFERHLSGDPVLALPECWYWVRKMQARFFAGDYASALQASSNARRLLWTSPSFLEVAEYHFYSALSLAASCETATADGRREHLESLGAHLAQLRIWAENCAENFGNRMALVAAEIARLEGRNLDAMRLYEQAMESSRENGFVQNEGLAHELAAKFYLACGLATAGRSHLEAARSQYSRWGAVGKVRQMEQGSPYLRERPMPGASAGPLSANLEQLDVWTVLKASQAISGEIVLNRLIEKLMRIAVEHAGAERCLLIRLLGEEPHIEADAVTGQGAVEVRVRDAVLGPTDLPRSALQYVIRTHERVVLDDASSDGTYSNDEYVLHRRVRSALCLPIVKQAKLVGALYLENNLTPRAFTADRVAVLELLASQAAISLENARLFTDLERSEAFLAEGQSLSSTGSFGWNNENGEVQWSEETYRIIEYDRSVKPTLELVLERIHPDDRGGRNELLRKARETGGKYESEHRFVMPDGRVKHVHVIARPFRNPSGNLEYVGAFMDISASKRAEDALRKTQANLAHVSRLTTMGELTASIAHEVNQPLTAVVNNANACLSMLSNGSLDVGEIREALAEIIEDAGRASAVIARVRQLARKAPFEKTPQNLRDVVSDVLALARLESAARRMTIRADMPEGLPLVSGDRVQLQQVLLNLVVNGMDAMEAVDESRRVLMISVRHESGEGGPEAVVSVKDAGVGFRPEDADRLFEAFYTTKPQGMGMGLAISRSIIEAHGGRLWAHANDGPGATVIFSLPAPGGPAP